MAEKQESSSGTNPKEKTSLLDLEIGKDFLTSWKSMSVTEVDSMDFDFSTEAKGKKKTFNFDDADMDFTLDSDFGKISSFNVDISDLDVSSPVKKSGRSKEKSNEASADANLQGKSDRFTFQFDFNEYGFDSLNFESSLTKKDKVTISNKAAENSSGQSGRQRSGFHLNENMGALEDNIILKQGVTEEEITSKFDGLLGKKLDSLLKKDDILKSLTRENSIPKSTSSEDVVVEPRTSSEKSISCSMHETNQESSPPDKISSPESFAPETCKEASVPSVCGNSLSHDTVTDVQDEVGSHTKKESPGSVISQHMMLEQTNSCFNYENTLDNLPQDMVCLQSSNGEKRKFEGDTNAQSACKNGASLTQGDPQLEQISIVSASEEFLLERKTDRDILDSISEVFPSPLKSVTTIDKEMPDKGRVSGVRSKYFNRSDVPTSQLQQASLSQIKITTFGGKRVGAAYQTPANDRKLQTIDSHSGSKSVGLTTTLPSGVTSSEPVQIRNQGVVKDLTSNSGALNSESDGSTFTGTSKLYNNCPAGEFVLSGTENNIKGFNTFNSHVLPSSLNEEAAKSSSRNCQNPKLSASGLKTLQNMKNNSSENNKFPPLKDVGRTSDPSNLKNMRSTGENCTLLKSTLQKDIIFLTNSERSTGLKGNTGTRMVHAADAKNQSSQSPTLKRADTMKQTSSSPTLKRKSHEEASTDFLTLQPVKRVSQSPGESRNSGLSSKINVDKQICNYETLAGNKETLFNHQTPRLGSPHEVNMNELETCLTMEKDSNVEKAEACAKELEDLCNMLKKKHEEAKEILVRALVNNNNLLMLNHPMYEEKIRIIQKFSASLMSK